MLNTHFLGKTVKVVLTLCTTTVFLAACSSTSTYDDASATSNTNTSTTSASTSGSSTTSTTSGVVAPTASTFYFDFDSSALRADSRSLLNAHAAALKANPRSIRLEGHADERGTREYNIALGERRAQAVRSYLESQGVRSAIEVVSYGEEKPAVTTYNEYAFQQNRRVEIK
jgi:peptidoglycan-associated lipoprotein